MAVAEQTPYTFVPPPPLPEFYLSTTKDGHSKSKSSTSGTEADAQALMIKKQPAPLDGVYDGMKRSRNMPRNTTAPLVVVPPLAQAADGNEVPPLAVYHICRICLRPRSPRYHREHPIPVDGLPPPPGICRRCRVKSVDDVKTIDEVVKKGESNEIKLGCLAPFVRDEDIISNEEMKRMKAEKWLREQEYESYSGRRRSRLRKDITYRHVRVLEEPEESPPRRVTKVKFRTRSDNDSTSDEPILDPQPARATTTTSMQVQPTENTPSMPAKTVKSANLRNVDSAKASISAHTSSSSQSGSTSTVKASAVVASRSRLERTESEIRGMAREETERYAKANSKYEWLEADIRRISREEVERYRDAERKINRHPEPYTRGRIVPVERRIEVERDVAEPKSWAAPPTKESLRVSSSRISKSKADEQSRSVDMQSQTKSNRDGSNARSIADSWGPKWRRELSLERKKSVPGKDIDTTDHVEFIRHSERSQPKDREPKEVRNGTAQPREPCGLSRAASYVQRTDRKQQVDPNNVIEITEYVDRTPRATVAASTAPGDTRQTSASPERNTYVRADFEGRQADSDAYPSQSTPRTRRDAWSRSSKPTDRDYWFDESRVHTIDSKSSKQYRTSGTGAAPGQNSSKSSKNVYSSERQPAWERAVPIHASVVSENTAWPEQHGRESCSNRTPERVVDPENAKEDQPAQRIVRPTDPPTETSSKQSRPRQDRSRRNDDTEYIYTERIVEPVDRPLGSRPFDNLPPGSRIEVEEEVSEWIRYPTEQARQGRAKSERRKPDVRDSDESNHVHFSSQIHISPTPPDSDASSSEFRSFHGSGHGEIRQVDGQQSLERGKDLIAEYERRGRDRRRKAHAEYDQYYEQKSQREQERGSERTVRAQGNHGDWRYESKEKRPLARAFSESPSREAKISGFDEGRIDGRGPYRPEQKVTDSMVARDGSRDARLWNDKR